MSDPLAAAAIIAAVAGIVAERDRLKAVNAELLAALETIAGGHTGRFPGAPDVMAATSPADFRSAMWAWSQQVARAALAKAMG